MDEPRHLQPCAPYERPQWIPFPPGFACDKEVNPYLKGIMTPLCTFLDPASGLGFPTYRQLSAVTGLRKWRLRQLIRGLCALGYLDVTERPGQGLEYRLKGGPLRLDLSEGGVQHDHTPPVQHDHTPIDMIDDDDDVTGILKKQYGLGAADAAAVAQGMTRARLRTLLLYVSEHRAAITDPARYILEAFHRDRQHRARRPPVYQLPLTPPGQLDVARAARVPDPAPPEDASWLTDEDRRTRVVAAAKARAFPQFARQQQGA